MAELERVLVVGGGGREHALAERLLDSPSTGEVIVVSGNAGTDGKDRSDGKNIRNVVGDPLAVSRELRPDLVVVGPEAPLCAGLVDQLGAEGLLAYGPSQKAASLEGSKAFMKQFASRHGIRTARYHVVGSVEELDRAVADFSEPPVIKADGLCAGKGVVVAATHDEAREQGRRMLSGEAFGDAGRTVVVEERISGGEASVHAISDGERFVVLPVAQDHKRIGEGDLGPNTGGMGCYAPTPEVSDALLARVEKDIIEKIVLGMKEDGAPFRGTLFAGLMLPPDSEPLLLEINTRFGDPETQVLMNLLEGDFNQALAGAARGNLGADELRPSSQAGMCVVLAAHGYPGTPRKGDAISGLAQAARVPNARVYHAGTRREGDQVLTNGGRVLSVVATAAELSVARDRAYEAVRCIQFEGAQFRRDIGHRVFDRR